MHKTIGENIRKHREIRGYSQEYMARELNITQSSYAKLENNSTKMTLERLLDISKLLEVDVSTLMDASNRSTFNQYENPTANAFGHVENLYQENKETLNKLLSSYEERIKELQQEVNFLRKQTIR